MADTRSWYQALAKPSWAPPESAFGTVWPFLYVLIALTLGKVIWMLAERQIPFIAALPFLINIAANVAFTPLQFGLRSNVLALADIVIVLGTIIWSMVAIYPYAKWLAWIQLPYLLWVSFATALQLSITWLNR